MQFEEKKKFLEGGYDDIFYPFFNPDLILPYLNSPVMLQDCPQLEVLVKEELEDTALDAGGEHLIFPLNGEDIHENNPPKHWKNGSDCTGEEDGPVSKDSAHKPSPKQQQNVVKPKAQ